VELPLGGLWLLGGLVVTVTTGWVLRLDGGARGGGGGGERSGGGRVRQR